MRQCPKCNFEIEMIHFFKPRFSEGIDCNNCGARLVLTGWSAHLINVAYLLASVVIYMTIDGNLRSAIPLVFIGLLVMLIQYKYITLRER